MATRSNTPHLPGTNGHASARLLLKDTAYARIKGRLLSGEYAQGRSCPSGNSPTTSG